MPNRDPYDPTKTYYLAEDTFPFEAAVNPSVSLDAANVTGNLPANVKQWDDGALPTFPANFAALGINASGHVSRVVLVDTTTANDDMRGTDDAYTGTPPTESEIYTYFVGGSRADEFKATGFATSANVTAARDAIISHGDGAWGTANVSALATTAQLNAAENNILTAIGGVAPPGGNEPVTVTVLSGATPIQNATVVLRDSLIVDIRDTNASGVAPLTANAGTYTLTVARDGYQSSTQEVTVPVGGKSVTVQLTQIAPDPPSDPQKSAVVIYYHDGIDTIQVQQLSVPPGDKQRTFDGSIKTYMQATGQQYEQLELFLDAEHRWRAGRGGSWVDFTPDASVYVVNSDITED